MKIYKFKQIKIIKFIPIIAAILIMSQVFLMPIINKSAKAEVSTATQEEITETEKQIEEIKKQQEQVKSGIEQESLNQKQFKDEAEYIQSVIKQTELEVQAVQLELQKLDLEIQNNKEQKEKIDTRLKEIKGNIGKLNEELAEYTNLLYKMSFSTPSILDEKSSFQDTVIGQEKVKAVLRIVKSDIDEVERLEKEAKQKNDELAQKEKELAEFHSEKIAQNSNLQSQQSALQWQIQNKEELANKSKETQIELIKKNEDLNQKIAQYTAKLNDLRTQALELPPSGNQITNGQIIGYEGRTGYVCGYVSPETIANMPPEDYAVSSQYCPAPLYFLPDINKYPTVGAHLHFEYKIGSEWVDPSAHFSEFDRMPMDNLTVTQGFSGGHLANDMDAGYGAAVYAVKPGQVQYFCDRLIPSNPAFGAVVVHEDGTRTLYWHMQRTASSPPCTELNYYGY